MVVKSLRRVICVHGEAKSKLQTLPKCAVTKVIQTVAVYSINLFKPSKSEEGSGKNTVLCE